MENEMLNYDAIYSLEAEILNNLETAVSVVEDLRTLTYDLVSFLMFVLPLLIGVVIGLIAVKTFWDGASRW